MKKLNLKEKGELVENINRMKDYEEGGHQMDDKKLSVFERQNLINKLENIKKDVITKGKSSFKNIITKGISLGMALSIIMSSVAFGGEHTVDNWESYKRAIIEDIMKQDTFIKIEYNGEDKFDFKEDVNNQVINLYKEAREEVPHAFADKNIHLTSPRRSVTETVYGKYSLNYGQYNITYKNSAEDMSEVRSIISNFISSNINSNMSDYEKIRKAYEYVLDNFHYDNFAEDDDDLENILKERNMLLGLQGQGVVCDAYAMLFSKIVTMLGYNNLIVSGYADGGGHAWNLVEIDNQWYHVDPTWGDVEVEEMVAELIRDNPNDSEEIIRELVEEEARKKKDLYFLTSDDVLSKNRHTWESNNYPLAPDVYSPEDEKEKEIGEIRDEFLYLEEEIETLNDEVEGLKDVEELENLEEIREFKDDIAELIAQIQSLENEINELEDRVQGLINKGYDELEDLDFDSLYNDLANLEESLEGISGDILEKIVEEITSLVEDVENSKNQEDLDAVRELVENLPNSEERDNLLQRLDSVQDEIDEENIYNQNIQDIIDRIENMVDLSESDDIQCSIDELEDGEDKDNLQQMFDEKIEELENEDDKPNLLDEAIDAVEKAESTKLQKDIDSARNLVSQLKDSEEKDSLNGRLDTVQAEIDKAKEQEDLVEEIEIDIEDMIDLSEIDSIQSKINEIEDEDERERLQNELDDKIDELTNSNEDNLLEEARELVELAESSKAQEDLDNARNLVNQLEDEEEKSELNSRLDNVQDEIDEQLNLEMQIREATEAVELAKSTRLEEDINYAFSLVNELPNSDIKDDLLNILNAIEIDDGNTEIEEPEEPSEGEGNQDDEEIGDEGNEGEIEEPSEREEDEKEDEVEDEDKEDEGEKNDNQETPEKPETPEVPDDGDEIEAPETEDKEDEAKDETEEEKIDDEKDEENNESPEVPEIEDEDNEKETEENETEKPEEKEEVENEETKEEETEEIDAPYIPYIPSTPTPREGGEEKIKEEVKVGEDTKEEVKTEEEIRRENLEISREKINELNTILKILPNMDAKIKVGDVEIKPDVKPYIYKEEEEKVLVPIRFVAEALGFEVNWSKPTWHQGIKKVFLSYEGKGIIMEIGRDLAFVNGKAFNMDYAPELKDNRTYVSLDFIVEVLEVEFGYTDVGGKIEFNIK